MRPGTLRGTSGSEPLRSRFAKCHSRGSARPPRPRDPPEAVAALEALLPRALDSVVERVQKAEPRRLPGIARPVDATGDLHSQPEAGGRGAGRKARRTLRLSAPSLGHEPAQPGPGVDAERPRPVARGQDAAGDEP